MKNIARIAALLSYLFVIFLLSATQANATTFTVSSTADSGAGSLRQAIIDLNATGADGDIIQFTTAGTIALESALPDLDHETKFDTNDNEVSLMSYSGGTIATKWFKFESAGTSAFTVGAGAAWDIGGGLVVGDSANGSLTISGGGDVTNAYTAYVGGNAGSTGAVTVTGAGSTWVNTEAIYIGSGSTGTLTISNGGVVSDTWGNIGGYAGGDGAVTVTGAGSQWNNTNDVFVGKNDDGVLNILNGGVVTNDKGFIASEAGSTGIANVDGDGSTWTNSGGLTIGRNGPGELHITDGGDVTNTYVDLAYNDTGIATVDGAGSTWDSDGDFNVGKASTATLDVTNGADIISNFGFIGRDATADGTATIDGAGSTWTNDFGLTIGDSGAGKLIISDGGSVSVTGGAGTTTIASAGGSTGTLTIGAGGASGTIDTAEITGGSGTATLAFNHTDASLTFDTLLSGSLSVKHNGAGTTVLSETNTHTGVTTISGGVLSVATIGDGGVAGNLGAASNAAANIVLDGGTLRYTGLTGSTDRSVTINNGKTTTIDIAANTLTMTGNGATSGGLTGAITKTGAGTLVLKGTFANTGLTTISAGTLEFGDGFGGASNVLNNATLSVNRTTDLNAAAIFSGTGDFRQDGTGTTTLSGANTYTGDTIVNAGTLRAGVATVAGVSGAFGNGSAVTLNNTDGGGLDLNGFSNTVGSINGAATSTIDLGAGTLTTGGLGTADTYSGVISGTGGLVLNGAGSLVLSGANTYSGDTTITTGTLVASNASALGNGSAVTVGAGATLDVGTNNVTVNNTYTQNGTLKVTVASPSTSGKITSNANAAVATGSSVNVTVPSGIYIPNNATFTVVDGAGGAGVNIPGTITSSDPRLKFSALSSSGDLILMVSRLGTGFSSIATDPNAAAVGAVLDNILEPTADMTDVLNTLEGLDDGQVASALDTFVPVVDSGVITSSNVSLNQFIGVTVDRLTGLYARAHGSDAGETGVSAGCEGLQGFEAWGRGFGEYLSQDPRGLSNGYRATVWGTAIGGDIPAFNNRVRLGLSGGYAQSGINSKDNSGKTDIDSYQGTLYAGYIDVENPYYLNGAFSFAYNKYDSLRHIAVGTVMRTANSDYDGQQYSVLLDGGYTFKSGEFGITPMASLQYERLHLEGYTEKNAGALNLHVNSQNYDMLQSGIGMKLERPFKTDTGTIIPEIHAKWLYDFIGDRQETTSTFSGGGGSFATNGFDPAQNSLNAGAKMTLIANNNWVLETNYDFEYKEDFTAHTGWADLRYKF